MTEEPAPYGDMPSSGFESQYHRVFEAAECRTQTKLADFLGIKQSSISDAKRRKAIPSEWLIKLLEKKYINPEWVRTGMGGKWIRFTENEEAKTPAVIRVIEHRPAPDCTTEELLAELVRRAIKSMG